MPKVLIPLLGLILAACSFQTIRHDPSTAALAANVFLRAMYVEHNYEHTLMLSDEVLRKSATAATLSQMVALEEQKCGAFQELEAESYMMTPGRTMELFYIGKCAKRNLYHRLVLVGDVSSGYRVSGVWFQDVPYPQNAMRRKYENGIVVK